MVAVGERGRMKTLEGRECRDAVTGSVGVEGRAVLGRFASSKVMRHEGARLT